MKKLIIFDMGNTLFDFHGGAHTDDEKDMIGLENMSKFLKEMYDIQCSVDQLKEHFLDKWYGDFYIREQLIELDVSQYVNKFLETIGKSDCKVDSKKLMRTFYNEYIDEAIVNPGAEYALQELSKDYHIGVISNCILYDDYYVETFEKKGLSKYIDKYIFSYSRSIRKPDKRLFIEMLEHFDVEPSNAIMVGDNGKADMTPASELGMTTIQYFREGKDIVGEHLINHFNELPQLITEHKLYK